MSTHFFPGLQLNKMFLALLMGCVLLFGQDLEAVENQDQIPELDQMIRLASEKVSPGISVKEIEYQVKKDFYQIQSGLEQLSMLGEVKGYFENAVEKSEEKFDAGEEGVTQSNITKLKLGLAGTRSDMIELETEVRIAKLSLGNRLNWVFAEKAELVQDKIVPVEFNYKGFEEFLGFLNNPHQAVSDARIFELEKAFHRVTEASEKMKLAQESRKITRALLVTEVANYDFGIGSSGDLFEALIIYSRVVRGYCQSIYNYNLAVAEMFR